MFSMKEEPITTPLVSVFPRTPKVSQCVFISSVYVQIFELRVSKRIYRLTKHQVYIGVHLHANNLTPSANVIITLTSP